MKNNNLQSNIWKAFLLSLTSRRSFYPILAIYFLTLQSTLANQIGIYIAVGSVAAFLLEIPSGYFSDLFGHKKTLVLSKLLLLASTGFFMLANSLPYFIIGSALMSAGFAFSSGTYAAFMHETLVGLKREKDYTKILSKISANASLLSGILFILLPFFTAIDIRLPLKITFVTDIIGVLIAISLVSPRKKEKIMKQKPKSILRLIKDSRKTGFYPMAIFFGLIWGFMVGSSAFREVYVASLGFPIIFIGSIMGVSRFLWFLIGNNIHRIEKKLTFNKFLVLEWLFIPGLFVLASVFSNPYLVGSIFAITTGYFWGRSQLLNNLFLKNYIKDKRYKATMLSIRAQLEAIVLAIVAFSVGFLMNKSYKIGFSTVGISLFILLGITYFSIKQPKNQSL